ncbi:hypothetical protein [Rhizobium sp. FY34]|uniref:hypothetical protein n=1 Tax=Rhizobium sp. FY34 TaxID=2562309 RepID=UPI0010BF8ADE|nr:hypothetical protein [Rhizobium sp. FY34]
MTTANDTNAKSVRPSARDKAEATDQVARSIIDSEAVARNKKTEKLKAMRLQKEASDEPAPEPKTKKKRQG